MPLTARAHLALLAAFTVGLACSGQVGGERPDDEERNASAGACTAPGANLQAILDVGQSLVLCAGQTYDLHAPLTFKVAGQSISTGAASHPRQYATLRIADTSVGHAVMSQGLDNVRLERVVVDGNRQALGPYAGGSFNGGICTDCYALVLLVAAQGQTVRHTLLKNTRTWSSLQLHEGQGQCRNGLVENNVVLWAGCDARGNGCAPGEPPTKWGDGISIPCRDTVIRNNLVLDATDVGIVLFGAPGSSAENNLVASVSRETFGGVALVDAMDLYALSGSRANRDVVTDYRGDQVRGNHLRALGGRVHIGVAVGPPIWFGPDWLAARSRGATIADNHLAGDAFGYGFVSNGSEEVRFEGNQSGAQHGGDGDGVNGAVAAPAPFLYRPSTTVNPAALQPGFVAQEALTSLLRLGRCPKSGGFQRCDYTDAEARGIVRFAYLEILGREPDAGGEQHFRQRLLGDRNLTADELRRELMASAEFQKRSPGVAPAAMQGYRQRLWENALLDVLAADLGGGKPWPSAVSLFDRALAALAKGAQPAAPPPAPAAVCDPAAQPAPDWGVKNGQCLRSCGGLGGTSSYPTPCAEHGTVDAGAAYDVPFCCKDAPAAPPPAPAPAPAANGGDALKQGQQLLPGQSRTSGDGRFTLVYQGDGNLVLYQKGVTSALWASNTGGTSAGKAVMQGDGNFVVYDQGGVARWASNTGGSAGAFVVVQGDGNVVLYTATGKALWTSNTGGH